MDRLTVRDEAEAVRKSVSLTINDPEDFVEVATSRGRVRDGQTDGLLGINDENSANLAKIKEPMRMSGNHNDNHL